MTALLLTSLLGLQPPEPKPADKDDLRQMLQKEREEKNRLLVLVDVLRAEKAWEDDDIARVRELMDKHVPAKGAPDYRGPEWHRLYALYRYQLRDMSGAVGRGWLWSPDGRFVATDGGGSPEPVSISDIRTGAQVGIDLGGRDSVTSWSPDGRWFAVTNRATTVVWDATTKKVSKLLTRPAAKEFTIYHHAWSPDGKSIALPVGDGTVRVLETATGKEARKLTPAGGAHTARWSGDGKRIAVAGRVGVAVFAADTGKELFAHDLKVSPPITVVLEWSPKGSWLAVSTEQGLLVFDGASGKKQWTFRALNSGGTIRPNECQLVWLPDDDRLLAWVVGPYGQPPMVPHGQMLALWDLGTGKAVHDWMNAAESPFKEKGAIGAGGVLYWGSGGRLLKWSNPIEPPGFTTWSIAPPKQLGSGQLAREQDPTRRVQVYALSPDGKRVAVVLPPDFKDSRSGRGHDELIVYDGGTG